MSASNSLHRFFGGSPFVVLMKLVLASVVVGVIMAALGLDAMELLDGVIRLIRGLIHMGFGAVEQVGRYFLLGVVVVVPIWLLSRLFGGKR